MFTPLLATTIGPDTLVPLGVVGAILLYVARCAWKAARGIERIEAAMDGSWTKAHQREFAAQLREKNPHVNVPDPNRVIRSIDAAAGKGVAL